MNQYAVHWFRRDLRVAGNPALHHARMTHQGSVLGFFCFDPVFLSRADFGANRFQFFLDTLFALREELREGGGDLLVFDQGPEQAFLRLFAQLEKRRSPLPSLVSFNRDYEPFARDRDEKITKLLRDQFGVATHHERDHLLIEPQEITREEGKFYQIYTPFQKRWLERFCADEVSDRVSVQKSGLQYLASRMRGERPQLFTIRWKDRIDTTPEDESILHRYREANARLVKVSTPAAGSQAALQMLNDFESRVDEYDSARDIPSIAGTSRFSMYLKNGSLNIGQIIARLKLGFFSKKTVDSRAKFLSELIWREFYYHILWHRPDVETGPFNRAYSNVEWENREDLFDAWKQGRTGFPIVDAGMRELNTTGWMHNRVRMIVASFLTKDLLIDWRWGERYFMETLIDGDLAPNNGGWQWAASTGCDPQPYFRIFNPYLQAKKFDPQAEYIRTFVPELRSVALRDIHRPEGGNLKTYPQPIVVHAEQRAKILAIYRRARSG